MSNSPFSSPFKVMVVDDEPAARRGVKLLLGDESDIVVICEAGDGESAVKLIKKHQPDILFLDIQMPGRDGFDVLKQLDPSERPVVIFVTAFNEHALKAFEVHAVDYLLKPFDDERFRASLMRAREAVRSRATLALNAKVDQLIAQFEGGAANEEDAREATPVEWFSTVAVSTVSLKATSES